VAIRYQRLNAAERRLLARGESIAKGDVQLRRNDWRERQALALIFKV